MLAETPTQLSSCSFVGDAGAMEEEPVIDYIGGSGLGQNTATTKLTWDLLLLYSVSL